ncbi:MAG: hypothetical protein OXI17_06855 [Gammaproteobacteria bacterium]|nr:hypothetical protein [Gammaproteobacteria bacterium]
MNTKRTVFFEAIERLLPLTDWYKLTPAEAPVREDRGRGSRNVEFSVT